MQRASETIGVLAGALAKAQTQLVNPEKSLVATIREEGPRGREQTFRYAPLSGALEIVRKVLGQHEIATVQTTSIDQAAGLVNLTTVLAHASGEWIASDWPVCPVTDTASPRRMGAGLTYARRYALFALVGIAGEDDLDAPDLQTASEIGPEKRKANGAGQLSEGKEPGQQATARPEEAAPARSGKPAPKPVNADLGLHASAKLRESLIAEIRQLGSDENAAEWVRQSLPQKNRLRASDATKVEVAFEAKLGQLTAFGIAGAEPEAVNSLEQPLPPTSQADAPSYESKGLPRRDAVDKSVLTLPEPRRIRDRDHIRLVAGRPCLACGRLPSDPHHLRFAQSHALSRKVSDEFTVPMCRGHHRELHRCGDEAAWWGRLGIDVLEIARALWLKSHPIPVTYAAFSENVDPPTNQAPAAISAGKQ